MFIQGEQKVFLAFLKVDDMKIKKMKLHAKK